MYRPVVISIVGLSLLTLLLSACSNAPVQATASTNGPAATAVPASAPTRAAQPTSAAPAAGTPTPGDAQVPNASQAQQDPKVQAIARFFEAYNRQDLETIRELLDPNIRWVIPGHHPLAGEKRGMEEVLAFLDQLGRLCFQSEPIFLEANDNYVVDIHRGFNTQGEGRVDQLWVLSWRFENGRIVEVQNYPSDQHAADAFFNANYQLAPIPQRLATP